MGRSGFIKSITSGRLDIIQSPESPALQVRGVRGIDKKIKFFLPESFGSVSLHPLISPDLSYFTPQFVLFSDSGVANRSFDFGEAKLPGVPARVG